MSTYKLACPHCQGRIRIRTSEGLTPLFRVAYLQCMNEPCGFTARAAIEITHELSPSGLPNVQVKLPVADAVMRQQAIKTETNNENQAELEL